MRTIRRCLILTLIATALSLVPSKTAVAACPNLLKDNGFEDQRSAVVRTPWIPEGRAGIDVGARLSRSGNNNAWARNTTGWNAIRQPLPLKKGVAYTLKGFVVTSPNVSAPDGHIGFRDASQRPVKESTFGPMSSYGSLPIVRFVPTRDGTYSVFIGFFARNGDARIRIDDVQVTC